MKEIRPWESFVGSVAILIALLACTKLSVEAKATGYKEGAASVVIVHVKTAKNAYVTCAARRGLYCSGKEVDSNGEADLEIDLEGVNASENQKLVHLEAKAGPRRGTVTLDLSGPGLPPKLDVSSTGTIKCVGKKCEGALVFKPAARLELDTEPGTVAELGSNKLTADGSGKIGAAVTIGTEPPLEKLPLSTFCDASAKSLGSTTLSLTFADGAKVSKAIGLDTDLVTKPIRVALTTIDQGKQLFPWETSGPSDVDRARRTAIYVLERSCVAAGPDDAKLADVVVVAISKLTTREDTCMYRLTDKTSGADRGIASGKLTLYDANVTAYQRATGTKLASRSFKAPKHCTEEFDTSSTSSTVHDQSSFVDSESVAKWALSVAR